MMIVQERSLQFSKSRLFFWPFLGASRTTKILKVGSFLGIKTYNVTAMLAVTPNNPTVPCGSFRKINSLWS